jgi:hypothetical protein
MDRSARSVKQNIVEGWLRNSTKEYLSFLGFSAGALAELLEDVDDVVKGRYERLKGIKGVMGSKAGDYSMDDIEALPFHPLPPSLPLIIQFKLQCKELSYLLYRLQQSLEQKMVTEGTLPLREKLLNRKRQDDEADKWLRENRPH